MRELNPDLLPLAVSELHDPLQRLHLTVLPQPRVLGCDAALRHDCRRLNEGDAGPALDYATEMSQVPGCMVAILGGVLAEGREHDAVLEGEAAESKGLEELGDGLAIFLGVEGGAGGWFLRGCEVGDLVLVMTC